MLLDSIDKTILRILQVDCSIANVALADQVALSPPACLKRVKRLVKEGIISKRVALLDPSKLGSRLHIIVEVFMERDRRELNEQFMREVNHIPQIKECYQVNGDVDFILIIEVLDLVSYEEIQNKLFFNNNNVKNFKTLVSMSRSKYETQLVIE